MLRALLVASALSLAACGGTSVGRECTANTDCGAGQVCYTDLPGGFCSKGCSTPGSENECPGGTLCSTHNNQQLCAPVCQTKAECRADYECNGVTGTDKKTCRPRV